MLKRSNQDGVTLIELMIAVLLLGVLLVMGMPSMSRWLQNMQVRNMSDSVLNGLQVARAEAVRRNADVRFQLVSSLDATCALTTTGSNWVVSMDAAAGQCGSGNMADAATPVAPRIVQTRSAADGSANAVIAADVNSLTFNGLGRVTTPLPSGKSTFDINISNPTGGSCMSSSGGEMRCLRVAVSAAGQIRMCDPRTSFNSTTEGC